MYTIKELYEDKEKFNIIWMWEYFKVFWKIKDSPNSEWLFVFEWKDTLEDFIESLYPIKNFHDIDISPISRESFNVLLTNCYWNLLTKLNNWNSFPHVKWSNYDNERANNLINEIKEYISPYKDYQDCCREDEIVFMFEYNYMDSKYDSSKYLTYVSCYNKDDSSLEKLKECVKQTFDKWWINDYKFLWVGSESDIYNATDRYEDWKINNENLYFSCFHSAELQDFNLEYIYTSILLNIPINKDRFERSDIFEWIRYMNPHSITWTWKITEYCLKRLQEHDILWWDDIKVPKKVKDKVNKLFWKKNNMNKLS